MAAFQKASDLVPGLYEEENDQVSSSEGESSSEEEEEQEELFEDNADGTIKFDMFNLVSFNHNGLPNATEETLKEHTVHNAELIIKRLFALKSEMTQLGPVALLPDEKTLMPREKVLPPPAPLTKWEKYSKEKGIQKKKRERMVWDEEQQKYLPRYGYGAKKEGIELHGIEEIKEGTDAYADPFEKRREDKKERVQKNLRNQQKNLIRTGKMVKPGKKGKGDAAEYDPVSVPGLPVDLAGKKRGKGGVRSTLELVQRSTASMGRFDEARKGEPAMKLRGLKRNYRDNLGVGADTENMKAQIRHVVDKKDKKDKGVTNSLAAYSGIIPDAPSDSFRKSKGKGRAAADTGPSKKKTKTKGK